MKNNGSRWYTCPKFSDKLAAENLYGWLFTAAQTKSSICWLSGEKTPHQRSEGGANSVE